MDLSTMNSKSTKETEFVFEGTENLDDANNRRSVLQLHRQFESYETCVDKNGSVLETIQYSDLGIPSAMEELCEMYEVETETDSEEEDDEEEATAEEEEEKGIEEEDIHSVYENEDAQGFRPNQLYLAVERRDKETVRKLLMSSVDVNVLDDNKSVRSQLYATVKELLNRNAIVGHTDACGQTSLCMASENGHLGIAQELLKSNSDSDIHVGSDTPLSLTAELGCAEIVEALIEYVGGINAVDINGDTALHLAARHDRNSLENVLFSQSAKRTVFSRLKLPVASPIHGRFTAGREHAGIVEKLILKGAKVNARNRAERTPLHLACENGHSSIIDILLENHATVDAIKHAKETPFYLAAKNGHADVVNLLLRRGIFDFATRGFIETPIHAERDTEVVDVISKYQYCSSMSSEQTNDEEKLQEDAKNLVENRGIMPIELVKRDGRLVSAGIVWTERSTTLERKLYSERHTALDLALISIQPKMVKILLSADRFVYSEKHLGKSFFSIIQTIMNLNFGYEFRTKIKHIGLERIDIMEALCYDILQRMKLKEIKEIARLLMGSGKFNVNYQNHESNTLLHELMYQCKECVYDYLAKKSRRRRLRINTRDDIIQLLLEKGADFNIKNSHGETPLMIASERGCSHAIQKLFDWEQKSVLKLDLDVRDQYGATALIKAVEMHRVSVMRLLLSHNASVNLHDYYGFTALHAAVYEPNRTWFDLHFFCKGLLKYSSEYIDVYIDNLRRDDPSGETWIHARKVDPIKTKIWLMNTLEYDRKTTRLKEEMVKLLLTIDELNVNATDFRGNTPLDLAVMSSKRITSDTFDALEDRGAIRNSLEPLDISKIHAGNVDQRGRSLLHRLIISHISNYSVQDMMAAKCSSLDYDRFDFMLHGFLLRPKIFKRSATATDDKGRTPLHYAAMSPSYPYKRGHELVRLLLKIGSSVNAVDMYGKTPLHYAENNYYSLLVRYGADENTTDKNGHTPCCLRQLRESVTINTNYADKLPIGKNSLCASNDNIIEDESDELDTDQVTELSNTKLLETVRIYSQSPRPKEASEEAIWKVWIENDFPALNRRVSKLKPSIQRLIERLANGIKEKDERFECQPILVGSADEGTKAVISADFDFNFKLIRFSQICDVFPHPLGPKGYFQLRRRSGYRPTKGRQSDGEFDCFFRLDQCLLTNEVNARFQSVLTDVLHDPNFWYEEHLFEWNLTEHTGTYKKKSEKPVGLCKTVRLRMINPIEDGESGFLFLNVSIDVVACVQMDMSYLEGEVDMSSPGNGDVCTLVFDRPRFDPSKPHMPHSIFSDTFARISFAPVESRIIRESPFLIKAAYMVCKLVLYSYLKITYQLKTSLLFCMKALKMRKGCKRKDDAEITQKKLSFWVERLIFCFTEFCRHDVYPCYFMPSFKQRVVQLDDGEAIRVRKIDFPLEPTFLYQQYAAFDIYLDLCPDDTKIDLPIKRYEWNNDLNELRSSINANEDPNWEQFDRIEFIRKLASRSPN